MIPWDRFVLSHPNKKQFFLYCSPFNIAFLCLKERLGEVSDYAEMGHNMMSSLNCYINTCHPTCGHLFLMFLHEIGIRARNYNASLTN